MRTVTHHKGKPTFASKVRAMNVGDTIEVTGDYGRRLAHYNNAKQAAHRIDPNIKFTFTVSGPKKAILKRIQ